MPEFSGDGRMLTHVTNLFLFIGGLGMFLYGMRIMADGMQKSAGSKMKDFLGMLTKSRFMAVGVGALITAIIQSSGATTVMVVGFVSAGLMTLNQAVGVIMGANIGTTITAWIVSLSQLGDSMLLFNPQFYAPLLVGIGALIITFSKSEKKHNTAEILIGVGLLFQGLKFMSGSIGPYTDAPIFGQVFTLLGKNPILGILSGALITALLQSSSVSVGILQTLAVNGLVTTNAAIFITLGENIGSCVTALLSALGGSRTARRAASIHLSFNVIGAVLFGVIGTVVFMVLPSLAQHKITPVEISMFHTGFKCIMTVLLFPFGDKLVDLSGKLVPETEADRQAEEKTGTGDAEETPVVQLDPRILKQPSIAVHVLSDQVSRMGDLVLENVRRAVDVCFSYDKAEIEKVFETEKTINRMNRQLTEYLIQANTLSLSDQQKLVVTDLFHSLVDIERTGDHAENIAEQVQLLMERGLQFSETGRGDLKEITEAVIQAFDFAIRARKEDSLQLARNVSRLEDQVDLLRDDQKERHIGRLSNGECAPAAGIVFIEIIDNLERISDHAQNLADYVIDEKKDQLEGLPELRTEA